ncbi:putative sec14 cytosolic factor protein [Phaeoacremonium minimum UCRPA7]|uniref:Putative sec14 cytosolic factor protein n=1 Tax=Phaeoacremonium minimum (strain UCR-PA7) TaxID=1286976 RepID=R8BHZ1_PHAM7|nr:putative sec14 cytosolic factor protein [Phaeoacremonium minimum UCRPA7]EON98857.1 putative sec14 cytosolic factor protein [Phaeoacremonium minimum UCRPA7]
MSPHQDHHHHSATSGPATKVQSAAGVEFGYPHGHLGHLNPDEEEAFKNFKAYLEEQGAYKPGPPPSHDDQTLLRFLRARRWIVQDAYKQFKETEDWRIANQLPLLYDTIDVESYEQSRRLYPQWTGRRDRRGIPVYLFEIRHLDSKTIHEYEKSSNDTYSKATTDGQTPPKLLRLFALYENLTRFVQPLCTELTDRDNARTPITLSTNIVDVSGVSLRQFWNLKGHMQAASQLATAHYPETLDRIFILGAPMFFSTVWGWIKRWFDPITVSKIFILGHHETKAVLESFIDPKNIPKHYGGELDFKWGEMPNLDPAIRDLATWENGYTEFPKGPVYWRYIDDGARMECIAVGSVDQKQRSERICTIPVAFPEDKAKGANGKPAEPSVEEASKADETKLEEATADIPATEAAATGETAVVTDGVQEAAVPTVTDPIITETQGVQNLSIADPKEAEVSEKVIAGKTSEAQPVAA